MDTHKNIGFSDAELARYDRHIILPDFGMEAQQKLKAAKVLVVGSGGLGSPLLLYLAAAGVGTLGIVDFDVVDDSNLQRQVLFSQENIGQSKVDAAKSRLESLNPFINLVTHNIRLTSENALEILSKYDLVADGSDNFPTRYLVNDAAVLLGKPLVYASIFQFEGQVSVFNHTNEAGILGPNYRDLYPTPPLPGLVPSCAEGGVLGVLPGIIGSMQALEVIKVVTGVGEPLSGRFFIFDALSFESRTLKIKRRADNPLTGDNPTIKHLLDYADFCGFKKADNPVRQLSISEFMTWRSTGKAFQLIDVREPVEFQTNNLGGILIPLKTLSENIGKVEKKLPVVIHCQSGNRSEQAIRQLELLGYDNLYNLEGGISAYQNTTEDDQHIRESGF